MPNPFQSPPASIPVVHWADALFLVIWIALVVHCLKRPLYPVFGRHTKLVWLVSFLLFNPVQLVLYLIFGVFASRGGGAERPRKTWVSAVVAVLLVSVAGLVLIPPSSGDGKPLTIARADDGSVPLPTENGIELSQHEAQTNYSCSSYVGGADFGAIPCRRIVVLNRGSGTLEDRVGKRFSLQLAAKFSAAREVTYYPHGTTLPKGTLLPDLFVHLEFPRLSMISLPMSRSTHAYVKVSVAHRIVMTRWNEDPPVYPAIFDPRIDLRYNTTISGVVLDAGGKRYRREVHTLADGLAESVAKTLQDMVDKHGAVPDLPSVCEGAYNAPKNVAVLDAYSPSLIADGRALFRKNRTAWELEKPGPSTSFFSQVTERLSAAGWKPNGGSHPDRRRFQHGRSFLEILKCSTNESGQSSDAPRWFARYEELLDRVELESVRTAIDNDATIPLRANLICAPLFPKLVEGLDESSVIRAERPGTLLHLATVFKEQKRPDLARATLARAVQLGKLTTSPPNKQKTEALANDLGDPSLADAPVDLDACRALGFDQLTDKTNEAVVASGESVRLYRQDGEACYILVVTPRYNGHTGVKTRCAMGELKDGRVEGRGVLTSTRPDVNYGFGPTKGFSVRVEKRPEGTFLVRSSLRLSNARSGN